MLCVTSQARFRLAGLRYGVLVRATRRPDEPKEFGDREALVAGAPSKDGAYVRVPKIGNNVVE